MGEGLTLFDTFIAICELNTNEDLLSGGLNKYCSRFLSKL